ncbi:unnamed protein product [Wuchereria bancrofti]|uniref:Uncharacterized protein n=1 Tax=Wuchereria bancrofti TaxID=6293 RepID=A0A3P7ECI3_WUCBA|nr:unnamed protein product [Wuchereria bancrofti]
MSDEEKSAAMGHRLSIHTQDDSLASEGSVSPLRHCTFQSYNQLLLTTTDLFCKRILSKQESWKLKYFKKVSVVNTKVCQKLV